MKKHFALLLLFIAGFKTYAAALPAEELRLFKADNKYFTYTGRIDFADPAKPRFWSPGVYITATFKGTSCDMLINDEELYGKTHNYIEVVVDGKPSRIQTTGKTNIINIATNLPDTKHTVLICKDTEAGIGYLEFIGLKCQQLLPPPAQSKRKIEYIGDSITAGTGVDQSAVKCGAGQWFDQHNAYESYGARTSRALNAQWQITAVAGIGLTHSCCNMDVVMPQVFDKVQLRNNIEPYNFALYQPDVVTICLGQNDGKQDSVKFCSEYVKFISTVRSKYPKADIVCLTSPMADAGLTAVLQRYITAIIKEVNKSDKKVSKYFFSRSFNSGCDTHPDINEHALIAQELTTYLKKLKGWQTF